MSKVRYSEVIEGATLPPPAASALRRPIIPDFPNLPMPQPWPADPQVRQIESDIREAIDQSFNRALGESRN